jgi:hypothetical protein
MSVVLAREIIKERYFPLKLSGRLRAIMGDLPSDKQWTMLLHGIAGGGKSTFALLLAKELTRFGNVLYGNFEESIGPTLQAKLKLTKIKDNRRLHFMDPNTEVEFWGMLDTKLYRFCIADSLSFITNTERQADDFWIKCRSYPNTSFIFICHALKSKDGKARTNYRGASSFGHIVDINQVVDNGVVWNDKNRLLGRETMGAQGYRIFSDSLVNYNEK